MADHDSQADVSPALAVVISGAPGSGKTTLANLLAARMQLPSINKDVVNASLQRSGMSADAANKRAFELVYGTAASWMDASLSLVTDMTMYPEYSPGEVRSLMPHGVVVNVHCRAENAFDRWVAKIRKARPSVEAEARIERGREVFEVATDPLDFGCERIEVDTTDGHEPGIDQIVHRLGELHRAASRR